VDAAGNLVDVYDNRDQRQLGLEVEAEGRRTAWGITPFANVCLLSNRVLDATDEWTTNRSIPALIASGGLRYDNGPWDARLFATYVDDYENTRFLPAGTPPERLGDFTDVSAQLGYRFGPERRHRVYIEVENLMDRRYDTVAGYPVDGRMLYAGLDMRF
jgi:outer membrane cobalamin receptor